jgi:hypothetical protein
MLKHSAGSLLIKTHALATVMTSSRSYQSFSLRNNTNDVACVEKARKEPVRKIRENAGMRTAEERMKERETAVGVEKSGRTFSLKIDWQLGQEEDNIACCGMRRGGMQRASSEKLGRMLACEKKKKE